MVATFGLILLLVELDSEYLTAFAEVDELWLFFRGCPEMTSSLWGGRGVSKSDGKVTWGVSKSDVIKEEHK